MTNASGRPEYVRIAAKELVAAITPQRYGHLLAGQSRDQKGRYQ